MKPSDRPLDPCLITRPNCYEQLLLTRRWTVTGSDEECGGALRDERPSKLGLVQVNGIEARQQEDPGPTALTPERSYASGDEHP